jgi:Protein of unknown function (DUF2793)
MTDTSHLLGLPYLQPSQAQKHVTHNEALQQLDAVVQLSVDELSVTTPPETPTVGDRYLVGETATGVWASHDTEVAVYTESGWQFYPPAPGWVVYLRNTAGFAAFDGAAWQVLSAPDSAMLGINATADAQTRLVVAATGALFTHDGSDHRLKINKSGVGDTASLLFQADFEGRAEMGLAGEDAFSVKVSADGTNWVTALRFDPVTAAVSGAAIQQDADDSSPGRVMLAEHGVLRSEIVGTVSQAAGLPTGAIIERSTTAAGHVVKWADGTIMMSRTVTVDISTGGPQDFPYPDVITTVLGGGFIGADASQSSGTGAVERRQAMAGLSIWTNSSDWKIRLPQSFAEDTLDVTLTVFGLWV